MRVLFLLALVAVAFMGVDGAHWRGTKMSWDFVEKRTVGGKSGMVINLNVLMYWNYKNGGWMRRDQAMSSTASYLGRLCNNQARFIMKDKCSSDWDKSLTSLYGNEATNLNTVAGSQTDPTKFKFSPPATRTYTWGRRRNPARTYTYTISKSKPCVICETHSSYFANGQKASTPKNGVHECAAQDQLVWVPDTCAAFGVRSCCRISGIKNLNARRRSWSSGYWNDGMTVNLKRHTVPAKNIADGNGREIVLESTPRFTVKPVMNIMQHDPQKSFSLGAWDPDGDDIVLRFRVTKGSSSKDAVASDLTTGRYKNFKFVGPGAKNNGLTCEGSGDGKTRECKLWFDTDASDATLGLHSVVVRACDMYNNAEHNCVDVDFMILVTKSVKLCVPKLSHTGGAAQCANSGGNKNCGVDSDCSPQPGGCSECLLNQKPTPDPANPTTLTAVPNNKLSFTIKFSDRNWQQTVSIDPITPVGAGIDCLPSGMIAGNPATQTCTFTASDSQRGKQFQVGFTAHDNNKNGEATFNTDYVLVKVQDHPPPTAPVLVKEFYAVRTGNSGIGGNIADDASLDSYYDTCFKQTPRRATRAPSPSTPRWCPLPPGPATAWAAAGRTRRRRRAVPLTRCPTRRRRSAPRPCRQSRAR
jgi:hypothetical protein